MKVYAKAMHVGAGGSVKVVLRYQSASEEPVFFGKLHLKTSAWRTLRALMPFLVVDERERVGLTQ